MMRTPPLRRLTLYATAAVYGQLILGAQLRHSQSGLLPHLVGAVVVSLLAGWVFIRVTGSYAHIAGLLRPAIVLIILLGIQLFLGLGSFWIRAITRDAVQPQPAAILITTAHVAIGALVLAACLILMLQSFRRLTLPEKVAGYAPATEKAAS